MMMTTAFMQVMDVARMRCRDSERVCMCEVVVICCVLFTDVTAVLVSLLLLMVDIFYFTTGCRN